MARSFQHKKPKNIGNTLKDLSKYLKRHFLALTAVVLLIAISALASVLGTYMLKPVVNNYILPGDIPGLIRILIVMGAMYILGAAAAYGYSQLMVRIAQKIIFEIRSDLFAKIQTLPLSYFDTHTHGEVMSRFTNDIDMLAEMLNSGFTALVQNFIVLVGTFTVLIILSPPLSLIVLACFLGMFLFLKYSTKKSHAFFSQQQKHMAKLNGFVEEMVVGQKVVKIFNHESKNMAKFKQDNERLRLAGTQAITYSALLIPVIVSLTYFNYAVSACVGAFFAIGGLIDLGTLASYLVYVRQAAMPLNQVSQQMNVIMAGLAGAEHIFETMKQLPEGDEGSVTLTNVEYNELGELVESDERTGKWAWKRPLQDGSFELIPLKGDVRFHDVVFSYQKGHTVLNKINLYAKPGQKIAFVGSTGAGKTTITNLINRFYEVDSGTITYDGIDVKCIKKDDLRRSLAVVLQDTHLFTGTIADNIRYGKLDATMDEVINAAKLANAHSFIKRLPEGYDTVLTGDGANLSQGQRQLLNIARAAVSDPPVLILDEATSSIDTRTEKLIEEGMDHLMENRTVFVIAHRLSTIRNAKAIMVLEKGEIIERGSHDELIEQKGRYYKLYTGQFELD